MYNFKKGVVIFYLELRNPLCGILCLQGGCANSKHLIRRRVILSEALYIIGAMSYDIKIRGGGCIII